MSTLGTLLLIQAVSFATAGIIVPTSKIIEGPSSKTTLVGPDGSIITSIAQGAKIVTDGSSAVVAAPDIVAVVKEAVAVVKPEPVLTDIHVTPVVASKSGVVHNHLIPIVADQTLPVIAHTPVVKSPIEPVVTAYHVPVLNGVIQSHLTPVVETKAVEFKPLATKSTISEHSQIIAHPVTLVNQQFEKVVAPVVEETSVKPIVVHSLAEEPKITDNKIDSSPTVPSEYINAIGKPATIVKVLEPVDTLPIKEVHNIQAVVPTVPLLGKKTTFSEYSHSIVHPGSLVHTVVAERAIPFVAEAVPVVTAEVVNAHRLPIALEAAPVLKTHRLPVAVEAYAVPVIGTKTTISESSESLISHS